MARNGGLVNRVLEEVEHRTGLTVAPVRHVELLEARSRAYATTRRELDMLGYTVLDYVSGNPQELTPQARRQWVQQARMVWRQDPQAGAAVDLMNDFVFGRGVPKPRAKDEEVQKVIDEFWDDPDNQLVLTSYEAQLALGTDLTLQCNLFILLFEGKDGKIKLGILNHDEVETVVRDPDNRLRALWYVASHRKQKWNFETDAPEITVPNIQPQKLYYEHWRNMDDLRKQDESEAADLEPPEEKKGQGRVYHIALNRGAEEVFGNPSMRRLIRWFSAYNDFLSARVDMMQAAAAFVMKRKVKGTPNQVAKLAAQAISRRSELAGISGTGVGGDDPQAPPRSAIITENENVTHEQFKPFSGAAEGATDAQTLRATISAGVRFPQSYLGDPSNSNLATATSLELPVLKGVESRQEIVEQLFRWAIDRAIEKAVDSGRLSKTVTREREENPLGGPDDTGYYGPDALQVEQARRLSEYEGEERDEEETERDLSYEFSMPSPLKRMMGDLIGAIANIAKTFDPNGTNMELNRVLLTIALGEGLEMAEPNDAVDSIFPEGYEDPALAAMRQQQEAPPVNPGGEFNGAQPGVGAGGQQPGRAAPGTTQEYQNNQGQMQEALFGVTRGRDGGPVYWPLAEARYAELPPSQRGEREQHIDRTEAIFDEETEAVSLALGRHLTSNGNGRK